MGFDWQTSRFDFEALRAAIEHLLERMKPARAVEASRYEQYAKPVDLGRTAAEIVLAIATLDKAQAHELAALPQCGYRLGILRAPAVGGGSGTEVRAVPARPWGSPGG